MIDLGHGPLALPPVEIVPGDGGYDYTARYTAGKTEFYVPARLPGEVAAQVARIAMAAHSVLGLRDLSRTDLIVDETGTAYFLEVNVSPGMTETSTLPMALEASGHAFGTTCVRLLELAAARGAEPAVHRAAVPPVCVGRTGRLGGRDRRLIAVPYARVHDRTQELRQRQPHGNAPGGAPRHHRGQLRRRDRLRRGRVDGAGDGAVVRDVRRRAVPSSC